MFSILEEIAKSVASKYTENLIQKRFRVSPYSDSVKCLQDLELELSKPIVKQSLVNIYTQWLWGVPVDWRIAKRILQLGHDEITIANSYFRSRSMINIEHDKLSSSIPTWRVRLGNVSVTIGLIIIIILLGLIVIPLLQAPLSANITSRIISFAILGYFIWRVFIQHQIAIWDSQFTLFKLAELPNPSFNPDAASIGNSLPPKS